MMKNVTYIRSRKYGRHIISRQVGTTSVTRFGNFMRLFVTNLQKEAFEQALKLKTALAIF